MLRDLASLETKEFDLLVIGGGITGACLAWDASLRGLTVALVDKADFAVATSSATSKLIHGGMRYLRNGELGLVRESLRERRILQTIAPHLVRPIPFLAPIYKDHGFPGWMLRAGMILYDLLSYDRGRLPDPERRIPTHQKLSSQEIAKQEPLVPTEGLGGGAVYWDCLCEPERLCFEFIQGASENGATVVNYCQVVHLDCQPGKPGGMQGATLLDLPSGKTFTIKTKQVANVAGPWADYLELKCGVSDRIVLKRSKGIHLITRPLTERYALVFQTLKGRHFFIIPWRGTSLIGTTDTEYTGNPDDLAVDESDIKAFLEEINQTCPKAQLTLADVLYCYAGVRPLVDQEASVYDASRRYEIVDYQKQGLHGVITAIGGKYTTSRNLASKMTDRIVKRLKKPVKPCQTHTHLLPGGVSGSFSAFVNEAKASFAHLLPESTLEYLAHFYGAGYPKLIELLKQDATLGLPACQGRPEIMAQVVHAIQNEMALSLCDILIRRTGIGDKGAIDSEDLDKIVELAGRLLKWDPERQARERDVYLQKVRGIPERFLGSA